MRLARRRLVICNSSWFLLLSSFLRGAESSRPRFIQAALQASPSLVTKEEDGKTTEKEEDNKPTEWECTDAKVDEGGEMAKCVDGNNLEDQYEYKYNFDKETADVPVCGTKDCWCCRKMKTDDNDEQSDASLEEKTEPTLENSATVTADDKSDTATGDTITLSKEQDDGPRPQVHVTFTNFLNQPVKIGYVTETRTDQDLPADLGDDDSPFELQPTASKILTVASGTIVYAKDLHDSDVQRQPASSETEQTIDVGDISQYFDLVTTTTTATPPPWLAPLLPRLNELVADTEDTPTEAALEMAIKKIEKGGEPENHLEESVERSVMGLPKTPFEEALMRVGKALPPRTHLERKVQAMVPESMRMEMRGPENVDEEAPADAKMGSADENDATKTIKRTKKDHASSHTITDAATSTAVPSAAAPDATPVESAPAP